MSFEWFSRIFRRNPRPVGTRNAYCSFCRRSYSDVGPLAEGPDRVFICGPCVEQCGSLIAQEQARRRSSSADSASMEK